MASRPVKILSWLSIVLLTSCTPEPINLQCADPLGTDEQSIGLNNYSCFQSNVEDCFILKYYNGTPIFNSVYNEDRTFATIIDMGGMECLSSIIQKPQSGYEIGVKVQLNHGYIIRCADLTFGRLFVDSWVIRNDSVVQVNIKRQYGF